MFRNLPNRWTRWMVLFLLVIPATRAFPQFVGRPFVTHFEKRAYNADNQNWSVAAGPRGLVYFGNGDGLLEFDGSNWALYRMPDRGIVRSVTMGPDEKIYVGSYEEFGYWRPGPGETLAYTSLSKDLLPEGSLHNDEIWRIIPHNGKVYFQSFSNIFVYDGTRIDVIKPGSSMVLLMKAADRLFVHLLGQGLCELIDNTFRPIPGSEVFGASEIKIMLPFGSSQFLVGASGAGFYLFDGKEFRKWSHPVNDMLKGVELNNGITAPGRMAIGTIGNGIYLLDGNGNLMAHLSSANQLQNNTVLSLGTDPAGNIWAGLDRGIAWLNLSTGLDLYPDPTGTMGSVYAATLDGQDLLIGTNQGCYRYRFEPGQGFTGVQPVEGLTGQVWDLKDLDGEILCGHNNGTYRVTGLKAQMVSDVNGGFEIKRIQDPDRDILLQSTYSAFVYYGHQQGQWTEMGVVSGFYEPITGFETDHLGHVWCTHASKGIFKIRFKPDLSGVESAIPYGISRGLTSENPVQLAKIEGRIVFPTRNGCFLWDDINDTIVPYTKLNQSLGEFSTSRQIIRSRENYYWFVLGNEIALFRISGSEARLIYRCDLTMHGLYLTNRFTRIISLKEGLHLICLDNGFALFNESSESAEQAVPAFLRRITVLNRHGEVQTIDIDSSDRTSRIPWAYRNLLVEFSLGPVCKIPMYRTRLTGLEESWTQWSPNSRITYNRLPAGRYRIEVQGRSPEGITGPEVGRMLIIRPPWYGSVAVFIIYGVLLFLGLLLLRVTFLRRLREHKEKIEKEEAWIREQQLMQAEKEMMRLNSEKLEAEVRFKNTQLADFTMGVIKRNEQLIRIRDEFLRHAREKGSTITASMTEKITRLIDQQISTEDDWATFETHFDHAHQDFIKRLKNNYPHLTQSDLKLCAYLRLNISSKEIAHLLNISLRGVEVRRYRLRKRLNMSTEENLYEFLLNF